METWNLHQVESPWAIAKRLHSLTEAAALRTSVDLTLCGFDVGNRSNSFAGNRFLCVLLVRGCRHSINVLNPLLRIKLSQSYGEISPCDCYTHGMAMAGRERSAIDALHQSMAQPAMQQEKPTTTTE
jgi:hypothetical protein